MLGSWVVLAVAAWHIAFVQAYNLVPRWGAAVAVLSSPPTVVIQGGKTDPTGGNTYSSAPNSGETIVLPLSQVFSAAAPPYSLLSTTSTDPPTDAFHCLAPLSVSSSGDWTLLSFGGHAGWAQTGAEDPHPSNNNQSAWLVTLNPTTGSLAYTQPAEGWGGQPMRRMHHACSSPVGGGKVYITGGQTTEYTKAFDEVYQFDPATQVFTSLPSLPTKLYSHTSALLPNGTLVVMGGIAITAQNGASAFQPMNTIFVYDTTTEGGWSTAAIPGAAPSGRQGASASLNSDGTVFVFGGADSTGKPLNDGWLLDPATLSWTQTFAGGTALPGRYNHIAAPAGGGQVIIAGGYGSSGAVGAETLIVPSQSQVIIGGSSVGSGPGSGSGTDTPSVAGGSGSTESGSEGTTALSGSGTEAGSGDTTTGSVSGSSSEAGSDDTAPGSSAGPVSPGDPSTPPTTTTTGSGTQASYTPLPIGGIPNQSNGGYEPSSPPPSPANPTRVPGVTVSSGGGPTGTGAPLVYSGFNSLAKGLTVGLITPFVVSVLAGVILCWFLRRRKRRNQRPGDEEAGPGEATTLFNEATEGQNADPTSGPGGQGARNQPYDSLSGRPGGPGVLGPIILAADGTVVHPDDPSPPQQAGVPTRKKTLRERFGSVFSRGQQYQELADPPPQEYERRLTIVETSTNDHFAPHDDNLPFSNNSLPFPPKPYRAYSSGTGDISPRYGTTIVNRSPSVQSRIMDAGAAGVATVINLGRRLSKRPTPRRQTTAELSKVTPYPWEQEKGVASVAIQEATEYDEKTYDEVQGHLAPPSPIDNYGNRNSSHSQASAMSSELGDLSTWSRGTVEMAHASVVSLPAGAVAGAAVGAASAQPSGSRLPPRRPPSPNYETPWTTRYLRPHSSSNPAPETLDITEHLISQNHLGRTVLDVYGNTLSPAGYFDVDAPKVAAAATAQQYDPDPFADGPDEGAPLVVPPQDRKALPPTPGTPGPAVPPKSPSPQTFLNIPGSRALDREPSTRSTASHSSVFGGGVFDNPVLDLSLSLPSSRHNSVLSLGNEARSLQAGGHVIDDETQSLVAGTQSLLTGDSHLEEGEDGEERESQPLLGAIVEGGDSSAPHLAIRGRGQRNVSGGSMASNKDLPPTPSVEEDQEDWHESRWDGEYKPLPEENHQPEEAKHFEKGSTPPLRVRSRSVKSNDQPGSSAASSPNGIAEMIAAVPQANGERDTPTRTTSKRKPVPRELQLIKAADSLAVAQSPIQPDLSESEAQPIPPPTPEPTTDAPLKPAAQPATTGFLGSLTGYLPSWSQSPPTAAPSQPTSLPPRREGTTDRESEWETDSSIPSARPSVPMPILAPLRPTHAAPSTPMRNVLRNQGSQASLVSVSSASNNLRPTSSSSSLRASFRNATPSLSERPVSGVVKKVIPEGNTSKLATAYITKVNEQSTPTSTHTAPSRGTPVRMTPHTTGAQGTPTKGTTRPIGSAASSPSKPSVRRRRRSPSLESNVS